MTITGEPMPGAATEAMGMIKLKKPSKKKETGGDKPKNKVTHKEPDKASVDDLFNSGNIESLLQKENDSDAQLAAMVLMSNHYRHINVRNEGNIGLLKRSDIDVVSQTLELDEEAKQMIQSKRESLIESFSKYKDTNRKRADAKEMAKIIWGDSKKEYEEQAQALLTQEEQLEIKMDTLYKELMLPVREAVLVSDKLPEQYKLNVVEGVKGYGTVLKSEDELLKKHYPSASEKIKKQIVNTVMFNIGHDLNSFDIIPIDDLRSFGVDMDKLFIATLGNPQISGEFIEQQVAPAFFPDEDPLKIIESWEALKGVTGLEYLHKVSSFASDGYNHHTKSMNIEFFTDFMQNSKELIPIVYALSEYGFSYIPANPLNGKYSPEYVERLKELGENLNELVSELDSIRSILPDYQYKFACNTRFPDKKDGQEAYIEDNPFSIALKQNIYPHGLKTEDKFEEAKHIFESLEKVVPERWRSGFIATYVELMSKNANFKDIPTTVTTRTIAETSQYALDYCLTTKDIELFATKFFEASLEPRNENVRAIFEFCDKHADKIMTWIDGSKKVDADSTWYKFSLLASDLYRYQITPDNEDEAIYKAKKDLTYAIGAVSRIKDVVARDKAMSNLMYALTDEQIGDVNTTQSFVELMEDKDLKNDAQIEIELEIKRANKGETTTWKKMEKTRQVSDTNQNFLVDLFGYGSSEGLKTSQEQYRKRTNMSHDHYATYSDENKARLEKEVERIKDKFHVTVNITWDNILNTLKSGRVISIWENPQVMEFRNITGKYHYETRRNEIERLTGNRAKGGTKDPHPIYAAAATPNDRDEYYGGTGGGYGECFLILKQDSIKDKTSFCYDDSFNGYNYWFLDWEGGITAKAIHNLNNSRSRHEYVEAQVLGGIRLEDIESINIPSNALYEENKYGWSAGTDVLSKIEEMKQQYPGIKINIIDVPKK